MTLALTGVLLALRNVAVLGVSVATLWWTARHWPRPSRRR